MISRIPTLLRRSGRFVLALLIVFISWNAWYLWPPVPEFRFDDQSSISWIVPFGTAAFSIEEHKAGRVATVTQFATRRRTSIPLSEWPGFIPSPDGLRAVRGSKDFRRSLIDLTVNDKIADLPTIQARDIIWSFDAQWVALASSDRLIVVRAVDGTRVADFPTASDTAQFSPDSKYIGLVSADGGQFELWRLNPLERLEAIQLPCRVVPTVSYGRAKKEPGTAMVQAIAFSEDAGTIAVELDRFQTDPHQPYGPGSLAMTTSIVVSRRSVGIQRSFELGSCYLRGELYRPEISPDGQWLAINDLGRRLAREESDIALLVEEPEHPGQLWDLSSNPPRCVKPSIDTTRTTNGTSAQPWDLVKRRIELLGNKRWLLTIDNDRQLVDARTESPIGGWRRSLDYPSGLIRDFRRSEFVADVVSVERTNWPAMLPGWITRWLPTGDYATSIIRVSDGRATRILPGRRPVQFDVTGRLWTSNPASSAAGKHVFERWSPEPGQPWWPIAGTVLALLIALWPRRRAVTSSPF